MDLLKCHIGILDLISWFNKHGQWIVMNEMVWDMKSVTTFWTQQFFEYNKYWAMDMSMC